MGFATGLSESLGGLHAFLIDPDDRARSRLIKDGGEYKDAWRIDRPGE